MIKLTESDRSILRALQADAGVSTRDLADQLAMSQSTLWRRINDLEQSGVIEKRVAIVNPESIGAEVSVIIYVDLKVYDADARTAFETFVEMTPEILQCYAVTGAHDYVLIVHTTSVSSFEALLMNRILSHPSVASASSQITLRRLKHSTALPL
ncbi:MAG: Lrp/AsnC family transcriptional regulator [Pseudomonadota bacterium]